MGYKNLLDCLRLGLTGGLHLMRLGGQYSSGSIMGKKRIQSLREFNLYIEFIICHIYPFTHSILQSRE